MAVVRKKISDLAVVPEAFRVGGSADVLVVVKTLTITNGDSIGSIYEIANIPSDYVPVFLELNSAAVASCNDSDVGMYETEENGGAVIDQDNLADALDFNAGIDIDAELNCLSDLTVAKIGQNMATIAGDSISERQSYTVALTINAGATGTGDVYIRGLFVRG